MAANTTDIFEVTGPSWIKIAQSPFFYLQVVSPGAVRVKVSTIMATYSDEETAGLVIQQGDPILHLFGLGTEDGLQLQAVNPDDKVQVVAIFDPSAHPGGDYIFA